MIAFQVGGAESDYVRVSVTADNKDGWLSVDVDIVAGGFRGRFPAAFDTYGIAEFARQLAKLNETVSGSAKFRSLEGQLELDMECDRLGRIAVSGKAVDVAGTGNRLLFEIEIDQSHLPEILKNLHATLEKHPIVEF